MDANLITRRVLPNPSAEVSRVWRSWITSGVRLHAPTLALYEVVNAIHQSRKAGLLADHAAARVIRSALEMPVTLHGDQELHRRALQVASRYRLPAAYDAHYVALAERLSVDLWTADARLVKALEDRLAWVRLVS